MLRLTRETKATLDAALPVHKETGRRKKNGEGVEMAELKSSQARNDNRT